MTVARSVSDVLADHVTLEVEGIDRVYLNLYVGPLQREGGVAVSSASIVVTSSLPAC